MYYLTDNVHCYIFASNSQIIYYEIMVKLKDGFTGERALVLPRMIVDRMEEDPLTSMLHITDIGYYPKAKHHFRERKEPINQYVFIYCIDGAVYLFAGIRQHRGTGIHGIRQPIFYSSGWHPSRLCFRPVLSMDYLLDTLQRNPCTVLCAGSRSADGYPTRATFSHQYTDQFV